LLGEIISMANVGAIGIVIVGTYLLRKRLAGD